MTYDEIAEGMWRVQNAAAEQRGADRMARAMVAALHWRAGVLHARAAAIEAAECYAGQALAVMSMRTRAITTAQNAQDMERYL